MIQANELRIGNWISYNNNHVQVFELPYLIDIDEGKEAYLVNSVWLNEHKPIPLTPEILEKCGFEKYTENTGAPINDDIEYWHNQFDVFFDVHGALILKDFHFNINRPKYLHQLQNLYFALTGTELNYQP